MFSSFRSLGGLLLVSSLTHLTTAQTFTDCDPLLRDDCPPCPALNMDYSFNWREASNSTTWDRTAGNVIYEDNGGQFTVAKKRDSPTLTSQWYIMFGYVEVHLKAAPGQGIVSSIVIQSDNRDEIDWELIGGNTTHVQTNYFGKGNETTYDRAEWHPVEAPMDRFVNYTVDWAAEKIDFYVDGQHVRTLPYARANEGKNFPQTPSFVRIGVWAGGDPDNKPGVIEWAGGLTDYSGAPYTMEVSDVIVKDYGAIDRPNTKEYVFGDRSGSWQSIENVPGNSTMKERLLAIAEPPKKSISEKFNELSDGSKIAVYAGSAAGGAVLLGLLAFMCFKKRRQGRREAAAYRAKQEAMEEEDLRYNTELKTKGISPDSLGHTGADSKAFAGGVVTTIPLGGGMGSPRMGSPRANEYNDGGFNAPYSPGGHSNGGYTEVYAPQPRANTNSGWDNVSAARDMGRSVSVASSQWGPAQPPSPRGYGPLPTNNGFHHNNNAF